MSIEADLKRLRKLHDQAAHSNDHRLYTQERVGLRADIIAAQEDIELQLENCEHQLNFLLDEAPPYPHEDDPDYSHVENFIEDMTGHLDTVESMLADEEEEFYNLTEAPAGHSVKRALRRNAKSVLPLFLVAILVGMLILAGVVYYVKKTIRQSVAEATTKLITPPTVPDPASLVPPPAAILSAPAAAKQEGPGTVIAGNFAIEKQIGKGGMGVVYLAKDETLGRPVAIKRMRDELVESGPDLKAFLEEARLVASLKHPNLVEIYHVAKEPNRLYLVFEYVEGRSLQAILDGHSKLSLKQAKSILHQVSLALDYAHAKKITHRDLKPANIMVTNEGVAKVMDFGLAHQTQRTIAKLSRTGVSGTPSYMAPEQELGTSSAASDVFALGVTLYQMLTGKLPFQGPNFLAQKRERIYTPPSQCDASLSPSIDALIAKALDPDPGKRFTSAGHFSKAFQIL